MESHAELLRTVSDDDALVEALRTDWRQAGLDAADTAMLDYVEKLTRACASTGPAELDALRAAGFDDVGITQITLIASFFNYINRVADGLGVARSN